MDEQVDRRLTMCDGHHPHFLHHAGHRVEGPVVPRQLSKANEGRECEDDNDRDKYWIKAHQGTFRETI